MDTASYAAVAVLPWSVVQSIEDAVGSEPEFVPFNLSYITNWWLRLFQSTGPCNDI
jgi:hypothetical protein